MKKKEIQNWWAKHPQTYGDDHGLGTYNGTNFEWGSKEFFERLDQKFYSWNKPIHDKSKFSKIFPYDKMRGKSVLEIGCGLGTMAMLWSQQGVEMTAVDLNPTSVKQTRKRMEVMGLRANVILTDGNNLPFGDNQFDYVYSWGVLHHSPNLDNSLQEIIRVLKPNAMFGLMLYHRHSFYQWYTMEYLEGFLHYENSFLSKLALSSRYTDDARKEGNPYTWPVTKKEVKGILTPYCQTINIKVLGTELDGLFRLLLPGLGLFLPAWVKKPWARRFGWSLWTYGQKK